MENSKALIDPQLLFEPKNLTDKTVKSYICPNATDQEIMYFLQICKTFGLNPLKRECYLVKYGTSPAQTLVGYEVYLKRAERSGKYGGMKSWTEGNIADGTLKGMVEVYRKDWEKPLAHEAYYNEYVQKKADGTVNRFWSSKPTTMIKKVAISQAFRLAFPDEMDGIPYTSDEVIDQEKIVDITEVTKQQELNKNQITSMQATINGIKTSIGEKAWNEVLTWHNVADVSLLTDTELGSKIYKDMKAKIQPKVANNAPTPVGY